MKSVVQLLAVVLVVSGVFGFLIYNKNIMPDSGMVIVLNGPSSVGKTSIVKALQKKEASPLLSIGIDNFFVGVIPQRFYLEDRIEHHKVMRGVASVEGDKKVFTLSIGSEGQKIIKGMHRAIAEYAKQSCNVIVDYITYEPELRDDLLQVLDGLTVIKVGVKASLAVIEQRETERATSPEGHARSHYDTVHEGWNYDISVDSENKSPEEIAAKISDYFRSL
jgi:chloramphenicol 3-O phosphotransferase